MASWLDTEVVTKVAEVVGDFGFFSMKESERWRQGSG